MNTVLKGTPEREAADAPIITGRTVNPVRARAGDRTAAPTTPGAPPTPSPRPTTRPRRPRRRRPADAVDHAESPTRRPAAERADRRRPAAGAGGGGPAATGGHARRLTPADTPLSPEQPPPAPRHRAGLRGVRWRRRRTAGAGPGRCPPGPTRSWRRPARRSAVPGAGTRSPAGRSFWTPLRVCLLFTVARAGPGLDEAVALRRTATGPGQAVHALLLLRRGPALRRCTPRQGRGARTWTRRSSTRCSPAASWRRRGAGPRSTTALPALGVLPDVPPVESYYVVTCLLLSMCALLVDPGAYSAWPGGGPGTRPWSGSPRCCSCTRSPTGTCSRSHSPRSGCGPGRGRRPVLAGVLLGLGIGGEALPGAAARRAVRAVPAGRPAPRRPRTAVAAVVAWLVVNVPDRGAGAGELGRFFRLNRQRPADPDTIWNIAPHADRHGVRRAARRGADADGAQRRRRGAARAVVAAVALADARARRCGRGWRSWRSCSSRGSCCSTRSGARSTRCGCCPLAVLARPRWRSLLLWQVTEAWSGCRGCSGTSAPTTAASKYEWFLLAVVVRDLAVLALMAVWSSGTSCGRTGTSSAPPGRAWTTRPAACWTAPRTRWWSRRVGRRLSPGRRGAG